MFIRPYPRTLPPFISAFLGRGLGGTERVLRQRPAQADRTDLAGGDGVDVVYYFSNMGMAKFSRHIQNILDAARWECDRYSDITYKYAKFVVELYGAPSGRGRGRTRRREVREYVAALQTDCDLMVYGNRNSIAVELGGEGRSLADKAEAILHMQETGSPGAWVDRQNPFKVLEMVVSMREYLTTPTRLGGQRLSSVRG